MKVATTKNKAILHKKKRPEGDIAGIPASRHPGSIVMFVPLRNKR